MRSLRTPTPITDYRAETCYCKLLDETQFPDGAPTPRLSNSRRKQTKKRCINIWLSAQRQQQGETYLDAVDEVVLSDTVDVLQSIRGGHGSAGSFRDEIDLCQQGGRTGREKEENKTEPMN